MKQAIVLIKSLKMGAGKAVSQGSHASVEAVLKSEKSKVDEWREEGMKKVVLKVESEEELLKLKKDAEKIKLITALIKDAGRTFFKKPTITCLAIGPDEDERIDRVTGRLKML